MKKRAKKKFPKGWDEKRAKAVLRHYESLDEKAQAAEDEAAFRAPGHTVMVIPHDLVPAVRRLLAKKPAHRT